MITKNQVKNLYYLDRDTNLTALINEMMRSQRAELEIFLKNQQDRLQEKDAGNYYTLDSTTKLKDGELENMQRFFRGAVAPYYTRQKFDIWSPTIPSDMLVRGTKEIKRSVGFMKYDSTGRITTEVNSMATFERVKDLVEWLNMVEAVCFLDNSFIFPDSDHFKKLEKEKGRVAAQRQVFLELHEKVKNKYFNREIT